MQVGKVGFCGAIAFTQGAPKNAESHFNDGVRANQQAGPWRDGVVALWQQYGNPGQRKAKEVSATITQEDFPLGPVDQEKSTHSACNDQAGKGQRNITHLTRNDAEGRQDDEGGASSQTVEPINDVDGVGHPSHGNRGHGDRHHSKAQQPIHTGNVHMGERYARNAPAQHARGHGGQQSCFHGDFFGQVFQQAKDEGGHTSQQDGAQNGALFCGGNAVARCGKARQHANGNSNAADAWCGAGMYFLNTAAGIHGQAAVPLFGQHQKKTGDERCHQGNERIEPQ